MISLQQLAAALGGEVSGDQVRAPGPGHSPEDRSMCIKLTHDGGYVVHSFAQKKGYDWKACRDYIDEKLGIKWRPNKSNFDPAESIFFKANGHANGKANGNGKASGGAKEGARPKSRIVAEYDYRDSDGTLLYQAVRYEPKDFRQRHPDGSGGWIWKQHARSVLYRWPDLIKHPHASVFVCEGEKDADRLASLGHCAVTIDGRGRWSDECVDALRGRDVFILEDNDDKGRERALAAATAVHGSAASIRVVRLPNLKDRGDVSDWLNEDPARADALTDICTGTPEWKPETEAEAETEEPPPIIRATLYVCKDPKTIRLRQWLYGNLLLRKFVTATIAPGGVGKSSLTVAEGLAQVSGKPLLGVACEPLRVWLWNLEDPLEETDRKIAAAMIHYKLTPDDIGDRLFVDSGRDQPLVITVKTKEGVMIAVPVVDGLVKEINRRQIDVLTVDPYVSCNHAPENDNTAQDMVLKEWGRVAERGNCAIHLVDHTRKMGMETEVTAESSRGAKAKTDACRVVRVVNRMTDKEAGNAGVDNHRLYFRTFNDKANLQPPADASDWFKLNSVPLGNGPMGSAGDSVGVVSKWEWPDALAGITGNDFERVAAVIRRGRWRESHQANDWVGKAIAEAMGLDLDDATDRTKVRGLLKIWIKSAALVVVDGHDEKRMPRKYVEVAEDP